MGLLPMVIDTAYLYASIVILLASFSILAIYGYLLWQKDRQVHHKEKVLERKLSNLLLEAQKEAKKVVVQATDEANKIILEATKMEGNIKEQLIAISHELMKTHESKLSDALKELVDEQTRAMKLTQVTYEKTSSEVLNQLRAEGDKASQALARALQTELKQAQAGLVAKMSDEFDIAKKEVAAYKEAQIRKIDSIAKDVVAKVTADALSRSISPEDQERLVLEALEKSKKENPLIG